jgi:hypothetical protein
VCELSPSTLRTTLRVGGRWKLCPLLILFLHTGRSTSRTPDQQTNVERQVVKQDEMMEEDMCAAAPTTGAPAAATTTAASTFLQKY